ncbi:hypothetical protein ES703_99108 [subsurface metagenome]
MTDLLWVIYASRPASQDILILVFHEENLISEPPDIYIEPSSKPPGIARPIMEIAAGL